uniref:Uncharacterized protein n=1 Tax=Arcella intermedia TaxID=1963864 RepID=A0A6B2L5B0_9EUKA
MGNYGSGLNLFDPSVLIPVPLNLPVVSSPNHAIEYSPLPDPPRSPPTLTLFPVQPAPSPNPQPLNHPAPAPIPSWQPASTPYYQSPSTPPSYPPPAPAPSHQPPPVLYNYNQPQQPGAGPEPSYVPRTPNPFLPTVQPPAPPQNNAHQPFPHQAFPPQQPLPYWNGYQQNMQTIQTAQACNPPPVPGQWEPFHPVTVQFGFPEERPHFGTLPARPLEGRVLADSPYDTAPPSRSPSNIRDRKSFAICAVRCASRIEGLGVTWDDTKRCFHVARMNPNILSFIQCCRAAYDVRERINKNYYAEFFEDSKHLFRRVGANKKVPKKKPVEVVPNLAEDEKGPLREYCVEFVEKLRIVKNLFRGVEGLKDCYKFDAFFNGLGNLHEDIC